VDRKYHTIISKLAHELTHSKREIETLLGNLLSDAMTDTASCDVMLLGSGSIRVEKIGPLVTLKDFMTCFPFDDVLTRYSISGKKMKKIFSHIMRTENRGGEGECSQVNSKVRAVYSDGKHKLESLRIREKQIHEIDTYTICAQGYHFKKKFGTISQYLDE
jgi:5'-nucleotidase